MRNRSVCTVVLMNLAFSGIQSLFGNPTYCYVTDQPLRDLVNRSSCTHSHQSVSMTEEHRSLWSDAQMFISSVAINVALIGKLHHRIRKRIGHICQ